MPYATGGADLNRKHGFCVSCHLLQACFMYHVSCSYFMDTNWISEFSGAGGRLGMGKYQNNLVLKERVWDE